MIGGTTRTIDSGHMINLNELVRKLSFFEQVKFCEEVKIWLWKYSFSWKFSLPCPHNENVRASSFVWMSSDASMSSFLWIFEMYGCWVDIAFS